MRRLIQKIILTILSWVTPQITSILALIIKKIFFSKKSKRYKVSMINLKICFPEKSDDWLEKMASTSLGEFAKAILEAPYLWREASKGIDKLILKVHEEHYIDQSLEKNKGIIFLTPHHGCWELSGLYAASKIDTAILFNPFKNQTLNNYVLKGRAVTGATVVPTDNAGIKVLLKFLKNNKAIGILPDHTPKAGQGKMSFFFNEPSNTITLINKLARKSKVPIMFIHSKRLPKGIGYEVFVEKINDEYYECSDDDALLILNKSLEKIILKYPEQYLWSYEKFRNRVGVEENIYVTTFSKTQELE